MVEIDAKTLLQVDATVPGVKLMWIQYLTDQAHFSAYLGKTKSFDYHRMRVPKDVPVNTTVNREIYIRMMKPDVLGEKGFDVVTYDDLVAYAPKAKADGHNFIEYNVEGQFAPDHLPSGHESKGNEVEAFTEAAKVAHAQGLKISAAPIKNVIGQHGPAIAKVVDIIHIQAQKLQNDSVALANEMKAVIPPLRVANPNIIVHVQFSIGAAVPSRLDTIESFADTVLSVTPVNARPNAIGWWVQLDPNIAIIGQWLDWYNSKYRSADPGSKL